MKLLPYFFILLCLFSSCSQALQPDSTLEKTLHARQIEDFNHDWKFNLIDDDGASATDFNDTDWDSVNVPHDWSIEAGYQKEGKTASSTGFVPGGIGWYRKSFVVTPEEQGKHINIKFDGVYNNSSVWINGVYLGTRPNGYSTFSYDLSDHLVYDGKTSNVISVKVDHSRYVDSRWYTGSGIYRKVQLIKTSPLHIAQWGVQITTPEVSNESASVSIKTTLKNNDDTPLNGVTIKHIISDYNGKVVSSKISNVAGLVNTNLININRPKLWSLASPNIYELKTEIIKNKKVLDETVEIFGIRTFKFDANKGFSLNGKSIKLKGVNLHHDAGAVGAAVPKAIWEYRIKKLQSIGVNAVRLSHNPHAVELIEVCDELGVLVMAEAFDEWSLPKLKSKVHIGDNAAPKEAARAYPEHFEEWAERDLKDLIRRDFNHPSVFMWSIGNEIEWTYGHYSKTFNDVNTNSNADGYSFEPNYDQEEIITAFQKNLKNGKDPLVTIAKQLVQWTKEEDPTRPTICGSVLPSVSMASGYGTTVDVLGFNYRQADYDIAHKTYPDLKILGTENWGNYSEWKMVNERDFVAGMFAWTGFAYLGEAGPWPRKGLEISFFDYAGFKTPRGHFYETLWNDKPKTYMVTTPAEESEFSYTAAEGWKFDMEYTAPPIWKMLRLWEWYKVYPKWNYENGQNIIVQAYTNCEEVELFLKGISLGKQKLKDFSDDNIVKWLVPYAHGKLTLIGYNNGKQVDEYTLQSQKQITKIQMSSTSTQLIADGYDVAVVNVHLLDENGTVVTDADTNITFDLTGSVKNLGVDNGWEMNTASHKTNTVKTHEGRAVIYLQSTTTKGKIEVSASTDKLISNRLQLFTK